MEKVRGVPEVVSRLHKVLAAPTTLVEGDHGGQGGIQTDAFGEVRGGARIVGIRVDRAHHADCGAHDIHRMRGDRKPLDRLDHLGVEPPQRPFELLELDELRLVG